MSSHPNEEEDKSWVLEQLDLGCLQQWNNEQQWTTRALLCKSSDIFSRNDLDLGMCYVQKHDIKLNDYQSFKERYRCIPTHLFEEVKQHLQEMVEMGAIRHSFSPWVSAVFLARKKVGNLDFA